MKKWEDREHTELTLIRTANECIEEAAGQAELKPLFGTLWQMGELTFLAGDTGKGKTILAVSIADAVSKVLNELLAQPVEGHGKVLYYDFELNDRQFRKRYKDYEFSDHFYRVVINPFYLGTGDFSIETIKKDVETTGAEIIIIDNITALALKSTQSQDEALSLMRGLKSLALQGLSVLVLAHTPKVAQGSRLNINHLAGSKHLSNFADSVFFIGQSRENPDYRYLKQVKCRNAEQLNEVIVCELLNEQGRLFFYFVKYDNEDSHITITNIMTGIQVTEEMEKAYALHKHGKSLREIAAELGVGKSTVDRWIKNRPLSHTENVNGTGQETNGTMGQVKNTFGTKQTQGQTESNDNGTQVNQKTEKQESNSCFMNEKKMSEKADGTAGKPYKNRTRGTFQTMGHTEMEDLSKRITMEVIVPDEKRNGTAGQRNEPILVTNKKGQQFMVYHPDINIGGNFEDWEPEPHEILNQVGLKKAKPAYKEWEKDGIGKANQELKKWIMLLIRISRRGLVRISELKALLEAINEYQNKWDYSHLPKNYEYADFIEGFKAKIKKAIISAKIENMKQFPIELDEQYEQELKDVLYEIG